MEKKYKIIRTATDNYTLKYKDKEFNFKTDIELMARIQGTRKTARTKMLIELSEQGKSLKSLTIVTKKDGKTYEDNTNREAMESAYIEEAMNDLFNDICKEKFGMGSTELLLDIGITQDNEIETFVSELTAALTGRTPSGRKRDE